MNAKGSAGQSSVGYQGARDAEPTDVRRRLFMLAGLRRWVGKCLMRLPSYGIARAQYQAALETAWLMTIALDPRCQDPRRLIRYRGSMNSQNDEDGIIHEIFRRVGATGRVFVEIGVGDGFENNTAFLASMGWRGYWVDASAECLGALERHHLSIARAGEGKDCVR